MRENNSIHRDLIDEKEEIIVNQIIEGFEKIDQWNSVTTPNLQWFQQTIELEQKRLRKKQRIDLITFIFVAVVLLSIVISIVSRQPILFLYFQLVGFILLPFVFYRSRKRVSNE